MEPDSLNAVVVHGVQTDTLSLTLSNSGLMYWLCGTEHVNSRSVSWLLAASAQVRAGVEEHVRGAMQRAEELEAELEAVKKQHQEQLQVR